MVDSNGHAETHERKFTGWFIPVHIVDLYDADELTLKEAILLAIIDSLSHPEKGCFASNEYLGKRIKLIATEVSRVISKLKKMGLLVQISFDGRRRYLKTIWTDSCSSTNVTCGSTQGRVRDEHKHIIKTNNKADGLRPKINLRTRGGGQAAAVKRETFLSNDFDRTAGALLRSVLIEHSSDLAAPPYNRNLLNSLVKQVTRLRVDRKVPEDEITDVLSWLSDHYSDEYVPKLRKFDDIYKNWARFKDARNRTVRKDESEHVITAEEKKSVRHKKKMEIMGRVDAWLRKEGYIGDFATIASPQEVKVALRELGEDPNAISDDFFNTGGRIE